MTSKFPPPSPPYVGPPAHSTPGHNKPIRRIVMHATVSPCVPGGARATAAYFKSPRAGGSAHYIVDPAEVVQDAYDDVIAWHAPPNQGSIGIEMCDYPSSTTADHWYADHAPSMAAQPGHPPTTHNGKRPLFRWLEKNHRLMLHRAAQLVAELCLAYDVPAVWLSVSDLLAGHEGITSHANVSGAWHESTHWDPGLWPRRRFMRLVRKNIKRMRAAA